MRRSLKWAVFIALMAVGSFAISLPLNVQAAGTETKDQVQPKQIAVEANEIKNPNPGFEIKLWTQGDKKAYNLKDTITFKFKANQDCYVTLLDIGTDGTVYKIFPNKWHKSSKITKDKVYTIPPEDAQFRFRVKGPMGIEYVKAIATAEPLASVSDQKEQGEQEEFSEMKDAASTIKNLKVELNKRPEKNWAESVVSFRVTKSQSDE